MKQKFLIRRPRQKAPGLLLMRPWRQRNVLDKASAAQSLVLKLRDKKEKGEAKEIGLVIERWSFHSELTTGDAHLLNHQTDFFRFALLFFVRASFKN